MTPRGEAPDLATAERERPADAVFPPPISSRFSRLPPAFVLISLFAGFLFFHQLGRRDLISSHEARAAQNAQRMIDDHRFGLPTLFDGQVDLQKPPGYYWLAALAGELNGGTTTPFITRLPAALAGWFTVLVVFLFVRREGSVFTAGLTALTLATAVHFTGMCRTARIDLPLTAAICGTLLAVHRLCEPNGTRRSGWAVLAGLGLASAILLKGPIGAALVTATVLAFAAVERKMAPADARPGVSLRDLVILGFTATVLTVPWFLWANALTGGEFLRVFVWHHNVERFLGTSPTLASYPWWYYVPRFAIDFLPWTPLFAALLVWAFRHGVWQQSRLFRLGLVWFVVMVGVLSASRFKRADYLLPAYPGAAIAFACAGAAWWRSRTRERTRRLAAGTFASVIVAVAIGWQAMIFAIEPRQDAKDEKQPFAEAVRREAPRPNLILMFRVESHLLAYHLGRPLHTLVEWGELNERLREPGPHYLVTQPVYAAEAVTILPHQKFEVVARLDDFTAARSPRPLVLLRTGN